MSESGKAVDSVDDLEQPVIIPVEAYLSPEYARAERDKLWRKVWLQAGRVEDLPAAARHYVDRIEEWVGVPVRFVGVGPERDALVERGPEATIH